MFRRRPPRLSRLKRPPLSPIRRWLRLMVWMAFGLVVLARWTFPPEPMRMFRGQGWQGWGGEFGQQQGGGRYRPSKRVQNPVGAVPTNLWRIRIEVTPRDMAVLGKTSFDWRRGADNLRPEVRATVREGGVTYTNVALHLKGSAGSFRPVTGTPGLTLNFSKYAKGQTFRGHSKISLNNSVQDPTYVMEALSRELFEAAGSPAPRTDHATLILNGRDLGLYVFAEGWGKPFLRRHFPDEDGVLYDSGFVQDLDGNLTINSGPKNAGRAPLDRLLAAAEVADPAERWRQLGEALDVERFAGFLAMEVMTCHWDGYGMNRNNYRVFHDISTGRMVFLPHGMDQMFGHGERMPPESSIEPSMRGVVARAFLSTPEGRKMYLERMAKFRADFFQESRLTNRVHELVRRIRPTLVAYGPDFAREHDIAVRVLCNNISRRVQSIDEQLSHPREPAAFDATGVLRPRNWEMQQATVGRTGRATFSRAVSEGRPMLRIMAGAGGASGSWRSRLLLGPGRYRFEGMARTQGVAGAGGVCLRISGGPRRISTGQDASWKRHEFRFSIEEPVTEVVLVCEFDSGRGEVVFDESSLRLVRE